MHFLLKWITVTSEVTIWMSNLRDSSSNSSHTCSERGNESSYLVCKFKWQKTFIVKGHTHRTLCQVAIKNNTGGWEFDKGLHKTSTHFTDVSATQSELMTYILENWWKCVVCFLFSTVWLAPPAVHSPEQSSCPQIVKAPRLTTEQNRGPACRIGAGKVL